MNVVQLRPFTIGGSEAAAACGVDPFCSPLMVWLRHKYPDKFAPKETEAMLWGKRLEFVILDVLRRDHGFQIIPEDNDMFAREFVCEERPWLIGHPDGFGTDGFETYVIDAKTTGPWNSHVWENDGAPVQYVVQLLVYMHLTGLDHGLLACLIGGQRLELRTIARDQEAIDLILGKLDEFHGYVLRDEPPPPMGSGSDADALRVRFPGETGATVQLDQAGMALVCEARDRKHQLDVVKAQYDEAKQGIQLLMGDAEVATSPADEVVAKWTKTTHTPPQRRFTVVS